MTIATLIACAGKSTRMGVAKALLPFGHSTFVAHVVDTLWASGIRDICVSLPECTVAADRIQAILIGKTLRFHRNAYPQRELLGSVQSALTPRELTSLIVIPVDMPFASVALLHRFISVHRQNTAPTIAVATHRGQHAHPIMFSHHFFDEILSLGDGDSLRTILMRHAECIATIEDDDARLLLNINTPQDYERLTKPSAKYLDAAAIEAPGVKSL